MLHVSAQRVHFQVINLSKITEKRDWIVGGMYINEMLICTNDRFILRGNWGVYRCGFSCIFYGKWMRIFFFSIPNNLLIFPL